MDIHHDKYLSIIITYSNAKPCDLYYAYSTNDLEKFY